MAQKQITISVQDAPYDALEGVKAIVVAMKAAKAQGLAAEGEAGVLAAVAAFSGKLSEMQSMKAELLADHDGFQRALINGALDLGEAILA